MIPMLPSNNDILNCFNFTRIFILINKILFLVYSNVYLSNSK